MPNDLFGFDDPVRALTPPAGFETVHQDGDTWAKSDGTREGTTRLTVRQANLMAAWFRGLRTIAGLDLSDLDNSDPTLLREVVTRSIAAALPAEVANQLPALADLLDEDIDLVASIAANTGFRDAVAASIVLSNAVANDVDLINAVAADADLATALAASAVLVNALAASAVLANAIAADADLVNAVAADPDLATALGVNTDLRDALAASSALVNAVAGDADLIAALGANTALRDALAASATLANAVANDGDLVAGLAALTSFVDAVAAALPLNLNADNLASGTVPNARLPVRLQEMASLQTDADAITAMGFYKLEYTASNIPNVDNGYLWHITYDANVQYQEWQAHSTNVRYARHMVAGVWGAWYLLQLAQSGQDARYAQRSNNLSDVASAATAATNLGLGTGNSPQFTAVNIGHASDTTLTRVSAGVIAVEGNTIRDTSNTPDGSNALAIAGTDTTKRPWDATDLKAAAQTWGGGGRPNAVLEDRYSSGTTGPAPTAGTWTTRPLNTEVYDPDGHITLASNEFTPDANGWVEWQAVQRDNNQFRLYNVTDATTAAVGMPSTVGAGYSPAYFGGGAVVAGKTYKLQVHSTNSIGAPPKSTGEIEVFTRLLYWAD